MNTLINWLFLALVASAVLALTRTYQQQQGIVLRAATTKQRRGVSAATQQELAGLLHGDWETAYRLVKQTRNRNPRRSEAWCWEKTIADLLRNRRR